MALTQALAAEFRGQFSGCDCRAVGQLFLDYLSPFGHVIFEHYDDAHGRLGLLIDPALHTVSENCVKLVVAFRRIRRLLS